MKQASQQNQSGSGRMAQQQVETLDLAHNPKLKEEEEPERVDARRREVEERMRHWIDTEKPTFGKDLFLSDRWC